MGTVRTRSGLLQGYLGKRTQTPSSSPAPFSCYEMQRRLNENLQVCPIFCLITGVHPIQGAHSENRWEQEHEQPPARIHSPDQHPAKQVPDAFFPSIDCGEGDARSAGTEGTKLIEAGGE